jgi:hypothetical protein
MAVRSGVGAAEQCGTSVMTESSASFDRSGFLSCGLIETGDPDCSAGSNRIRDQGR